MTDVHSRIHKVKTTRKELKKTDMKEHPWDPIPPVAKQLINQAWLLCFDEFQVRNLFKKFLSLNIVIEKYI